MNITRRQTAFSLAALLAASRARAQTCGGWQPARPIEIVVGFPPCANSDLPEILQEARQGPGEISYASSGIGSIYHALYVLLERASGTELLHAPYQGGVAPEDIGGLLDTRQIRLLAVASAERLPRFRTVPTLRELGWDVQVEGMKGLVAPAGLSDAAAASLHDRFREAMAAPAWSTFIERTGATEGYLDGPAFQAEMNRITDGLRAALRSN